MSFTNNIICNDYSVNNKKKTIKIAGIGNGNQFLEYKGNIRTIASSLRQFIDGERAAQAQVVTTTPPLHYHSPKCAQHGGPTVCHTACEYTDLFNDTLKR